MRKRILIKCACGCGKELWNIDKDGRLRKYAGRGHCSRGNKYNYKGGNKKICIICSNDYFSYVRNRKYCSKVCSGKAHSGENGSAWKGGVSKDTIYMRQKRKEYNNDRGKELRKKYAFEGRYKATRKRYEQRNREKVRFWKRISEANRRIRSGPRLTVTIMQEIYEDNIKKYDTLTCYLCNKPIEFGEDNIDHRIPISRGGTNSKENLEITHRRCNMKKHNKLLKEVQNV